MPQTKLHRPDLGHTPWPQWNPPPIETLGLHLCCFKGDCALANDDGSPNGETLSGKESLQALELDASGCWARTAKGWCPLDLAVPVPGRAIGRPRCAGGDRRQP